MQYIRIGRTGLPVSRIDLGCMSCGVPERGARPWTPGEAARRPRLRQAPELGINHFATKLRFGISKPGHPADAVAAPASRLRPGAVAPLQASYPPHPVVAFE